MARLSLERKIKLIEAFYHREWLGEPDPDPYGVIKILSDNQGREFRIEFTSTDPQLEEYWYNERLTLDEKGYLQAGSEAMTNELRARLFKANTTDRKELVKFWQEDDPNWAQRYEWNLSQAFDAGHTILEIIPYEGDVTFCSLRCQASEESQAYYIHYDDGDLHVTLKGNWRLPANENQPFVYAYHTLSYDELRSQSGFENI